ncbi:ATP-grasp peptide maturase system methyltransferase [Qaidamihabitans albus]|uniref:ATP-grasp peptide maturase system methyltransferase n=1 Tax=Qaidamihabitans albus TaxID=2795733 RepID=UPI0018F2159C|nr:ATP-grasp peptide maturase system methyltransferase [Qaidamihabitans albus]
MSLAARARRRLAENLRRDGTLTDARWVAAFRRVPRHVFVPRFFLPERGRWVAVDRSDPGWLPTVYSDSVLVTQLDDDPHRWAIARREGPVDGVPTCSSSMPGIMAVMLEELLVADGHRVLEIGSGTGYNTALLCTRLGDENVCTVDIDPVLVASARTALGQLGHAPVCEVADGERGFPAGAPYDRVLCTCAVSRIPLTWLEQSRPGGLIVTTLNRPIGAGLVRIVAGRDATGQGRVLARDGRFMPLRAHRLRDNGANGTAAVPGARSGQARTTELPLTTVVSAASRFEFFAGLALEGVTTTPDPEDPASSCLVHADGSWARQREEDDGRYVVEQGGPRRLWDLAEEAYDRWHGLGKPGRDAFGVTVTAEGQEFWLRDPDSPHRWPLAPS